MRRIGASGFVLRGTGLSLYGAARLASSNKTSTASQRVVHISPAYFNDRSYIGGGERYATVLAGAVAKLTDTTLVTFGPTRDSFRIGALKVEVYPTLKLIDGQANNPLCYSFLREILRADVVHCYQYRSVVTNLAVMVGRVLRKRVFVSDLGGGGTFNFTERYPLGNLVDVFLPISRFAVNWVPQGRPSEVIYGGVDRSFLEPELAYPRERKALFVGRLLPHKGINYLIEGIDKDIPLEVVGRPYDPKYFELLKQLAETKQVQFVTDASDEYLAAAYPRATVAILPSVFTDVYGDYKEMPELLGLVMLESMACGTPVICTDVASMPEFVEDGVTGFVVPPNDPQALGERVRYLIGNPDVAERMGRAGRDRVLRNYTWETVAQHCLAVYRGEVA